MTTQIQTKLRTKLSLANARKAFSLIELLVVIAIIGIIAAIAIPNISGMTDSAQKSVAQRNAQNLASVMASASAAGATITGATTVDQVSTIVTGVSPGSGAFAGKTFSVPGLSQNDQTDAEEYLTEAASPTVPSYDPNKTPTFHKN